MRGGVGGVVGGVVGDSVGDVVYTMIRGARWEARILGGVSMGNVHLRVGGRVGRAAVKQEGAVVG